MDNDNLKKGITFGLFGVVLIGLQPIVANSRPSEIDAYIFAAITILIEALLFFPIMMIERRSFKSKLANVKNEDDKKDIKSLLNGWKNNK
ncbi:MAG: hypothetical protein GF383_01710, partial [Candidatus Lokiarchaeota archaeon]|nr:hypothetical protein [Candidatus Lokiarchaeota archaeon]MBD3338023.1 hypothetical protein [Candidatus Lokiarchaeota archaeon]